MIISSPLLISFAILVAAVDVQSDPKYNIDQPIREIIEVHRLNVQEADLARRAAATFFYVGLCNGVGATDSLGAIQLILAADPKVPYQAAALGMLAIYTRASLGRKNGAICEKAFEDSKRP